MDGYLSTMQDRFGLITFNNQYFALQPLQLIEQINLGELKNKIMAIKPGGGTSLSEGIPDVL